MKCIWARQTELLLTRESSVEFYKVFSTEHTEVECYERASPILVALQDWLSRAGRVYGMFEDICQGGPPAETPKPRARSDGGVLSFPVWSPGTPGGHQSHRE